MIVIPLRSVSMNCPTKRRRARGAVGLLCCSLSVQSWPRRTVWRDQQSATRSMVALPLGPIAELVASARRSAGGGATMPARICEINAQRGFAEALCRRHSCNHSKYTALYFAEQIPDAPKHHWLSVIKGASTYSMRGKGRSQLGSCDIVVVHMDGPSAAQRMALLHELPHLLQAATPGAVLVLRGQPCRSGLALQPYERAHGREKLTERCWQSRWQELATEGALIDPTCHAHNCVARLATSASVCATIAPLLLPTDKQETVVLKAASVFWRKGTAGRQTLSHLLRRHLRYFSAFDCPEAVGDERVCLLFKDEVVERWVAGVTSTDGLIFASDPELVMPRLTLAWWADDAAASMTHNFAISRGADGRFFAVGGRHNALRDKLVLPNSKRVHKLVGSRRASGAAGPYQSNNQSNETQSRQGAEAVKIEWGWGMHRPVGSVVQLWANRVGVWLASGSSWRFDTPVLRGRRTQFMTADGMISEPPTTQWHSKRLALTGQHAGCVEARNASSDIFRKYLLNSTCEFDGRLSLVSHNGELLLYTRANTLGRGGGRHVQVTRSTDEGRHWSSFTLVQIDGYGALGAGDIYFFAVQTNPVHNQSLVAVFPIVHRLKGCIGLATSLDGVHWSRVTPLVSCDIYGGRTLDQPAAPALVRRHEAIWFYVHESVPSATLDIALPRKLDSHLQRTEPPARVVRYTLPAERLAEWTRGSLDSVRV